MSTTPSPRMYSFQSTPLHEGRRLDYMHLSHNDKSGRLREPRPSWTGSEMKEAGELHKGMNVLDFSAARTPSVPSDRFGFAH